MVFFPVKDAAAKSGVIVQVVKVSNRMEITKAGVKMTPDVIVDGQVKLIGKIPEIDDVLRWISERMTQDGKSHK